MLILEGPLIPTFSLREKRYRRSQKKVLSRAIASLTLGCTEISCAGSLFTDALSGCPSDEFSRRNPSSTSMLSISLYSVTRNQL
ncbi:hypothetical protein CDAR_571321 [Caerostris darwini]|uniref:Uncharacterized protein n=1 Tax=Caerostris darwini TaxID=1538125 RepID=A0AAV4SNK6_9ARAC|nr:hypothetical protein CDAR_571321 [Caerostris darwini]